jgi:hypothetical protein
MNNGGKAGQRTKVRKMSKMPKTEHPYGNLCFSTWKRLKQVVLAGAVVHLL